MVKGSSYGQRRPPLTLILKTILERYPDGGQILKEIIQNADDAGARTVKFLLDSREKHYGTRSLYRPELAKFQGPALYAQNDALFTDQDWEGIESLMQSNKKEDPMKVGRFGIGFNSVYHITDLPSIVSGERLAFLDPHEIYFGRNETGQSFNLNDPDPYEKPPLTEFYDQFSPFEGVLDCSISKRRYQGTLFRFPLRNEPSDLSKKTYNSEKVRLLFKSLQEEASLILLFLKNVDKICIYETTKQAKESLLFTVQIQGSCRNEVWRRKQELLQKVRKWTFGQIEKVDLSLEVTVEEVTQSGTKTEHKWFVHNRIGAKNDRLRKLASELALLPWMGFATPLTVNDRQAMGPYGGRLFCFLPLPLDSDVKTELPVHVHGAFGLSDNRRELKWPGGERQNDEAAEWNQLLLDKVGAKAYARMLLDLIQVQMKQDGSTQSNIASTYKAWPQIHKVQFHWRRILDPMFKILANENILWTPSGGGRWIKPENAIFNRMESSARGVSQAARTIVETVLIKANENLVAAPDHVLQAIDTFMQNVARNEITPDYLRRLMKMKRQTSSIIPALSNSEKLLLLEYVVSDNSAEDLQGLPLLPLASGSFTDFACIRNMNRAVYVATSEMPRNLLPNMEEKFLYDAKYYAAHDFLCSAARRIKNGLSGPTQLFKLEKELISRLLKENSLPRQWFGPNDYVEWHPGTNGAPPLSWIKDIWRLLRREFPYDIQSFENIPLVFTKDNQRLILVKLRRNSQVIRQTAAGYVLPGPVAELLRKAGAIVMSEVPQYMEHNCLRDYVASPTPGGVLHVLNTIGASRCVQMINTCSLNQKRALRDFLAGMHQYLTAEQTNLLRRLPLFDSLDGNSFIAVNHPVAPRDLILPHEISVINAHQIISIKDENAQRLLGLLGVVPMKKTVFLKEHVLCGVRNKLYTQDKISILMHWVLERLQIFSEEDMHFVKYLQSLEFVPVGNNKFAYPSDVFDPREPLLDQLFRGEVGKFPQGKFTEPRILNQLQLVGIKNVASLQASDLASAATKLRNFDESLARVKAQAMMKLLYRRSDLLNNVPFLEGKKRTLKTVLEEANWVPCLKTCPKSYPKGMKWFGGSSNLFRPTEVASLHKATIIGASMPVLENEIPSSLALAFDWQKEPPIDKVIHQLKIAVTSVPWQYCPSQNFQLMLQEIYQQLSSFFNAYVFQSLKTSSFPPWVWHGSGFAAPSRIIVSSRCEINVEPHLFVLSTSYNREVHELFLRFGARETMEEPDYLDVLRMLKETHEGGGKNEEDALHDLHLTVNILNWIVRKGKELSKELKEKVFVPVGTFNNTLKLVPCRQATFGDIKWLREGGLQSRHIVLKYTMIHEKISHTTAKLLGVPPISNRVTGAKPIGFHAAGPHESITTRLSNILKEYKEGVGVFKELVQNADDAGATEVKFLIDWRHHETESLFSSGMRNCQGPALVAWSNSIFTDEDFQNIQKLAGATKKDDLEKIGRFGLGFNSVYHFTDVPSFVSRNFAVFFDPCTTHLGEMIEDKSRPGIMIDFEENQDSLHAYPDQFKPYHGLFGCDTSLSAADTRFYYNGTIFRFPFRTTKSKISHEVYNRGNMEIITKSLQDAASNLLLFVQNVKAVTVLELSDDDMDPASPNVCFKLKRNEVCELPHRKLSSCSTFLKACAAFCTRRSGAEVHALPLQQSEIVSLSYSDPFETKQSMWLTSSSLGEGKSADVAYSQEGRTQGLMAVVGVAAEILVKKQSSREENYESKKNKGEAFCFLPLSISTGLPVHVNGYFAVTSNRRDIWKQATTDLYQLKPIEVRWNECLMEDALARAYINLLEDMVVLQKSGSLKNYRFSLLWPDPDDLTSNSWIPLIKGAYQLIASTDTPLVQSGSEWSRINECIYPDGYLQSLPHSVDILRLFGYKVVDLPPFARKSFDIAGVGEIINQQTMTQEKFLRNVFFPRLQTISPELRDPMVCFLLDKCLASGRSFIIPSSHSFYMELLRNKSYQYIPCSFDGQKLAHPQELISPTGEVSKLFGPEDNRFPVGECFRSPERLLMLTNLGMVDDLSWEDVLERCESVIRLHQSNNQNAARVRITELVRHLKKQHKRLGKPSPDLLQHLRSLRILPVKVKPPDGYPLQWKGSRCPHFLSATEVYEDKYSFTVGAFDPVVDESETGCGKIGADIKKLLGFRGPSPINVIAQLKASISFQISSSGSHAESVEKIVLSIYEFLQTNLTHLGDLLEEQLFDESWILVDNKFVTSSQVAFSWQGYGAPYLYSLPDSLTQVYRTLFEAAGVKDSFPKSAFIEALHRFKSEKEEKALTNAELSVVKCCLNELADTDEDILSKEKGRVPLPDEQKILRPANELAINDVPWLTTISSATKFVHHDVPAKLAYDLGAKDIRTKQLGEISRPLGIPFGQREKLTDRIKSILKAYPRDVGILKELVQNADDARATEIHFVYDQRYHKTERMLNETWHELQGPALCVYNNRPFSENDLEGIQRLGIGSKVDDPTKTGQYGIGFNAVYHLTDCPSFISNGDTLCILDPQVRYAPNASFQDPGRLIPLKESIRTDYSDSFLGYLEEFFDLTQATMFRLPLRDGRMARNSDISKDEITQAEIEKLMAIFSAEAKEILLFLKHVRKISLSKIEDGKLLPIYSVSADLSADDTQKRKDFSAHVKNVALQNTDEVNPFSVTYSMKITELWRKEMWLVHQSIGLEGVETENIPNGKPFGLLPQAGVAAKVTEVSASRYTHSSTTRAKYKAFCFLPLPVNTGLPLHVNGHFYLDSGRRHLWHDEDDKGFRSSWNHFIKSRLLPHAYIALLQNAKDYIPGQQSDGSFATVHKFRLGMDWYNSLFPPVETVESQWKELSTSFYQLVSKQQQTFFPVLQGSENQNQSPQHFCQWLSTSQGFFNNLSSDEQDTDLAKVILRVGFPLFHSPHQLFKNFKTSDAQAKELRADAVIDFLKTLDATESRCTIGNLPCKLGDTTIASVGDLLNLVAYCMKSPKFVQKMEGLPLLLTVDNVLRTFTNANPIFLSSFHDLVPSSPHLFVKGLLRSYLEIHREMILRSKVGVKEFDVISLEPFLSHTLPLCWREINAFVIWEPGKSETPTLKWVKRLWEFLCKEMKSSKKQLDPLYPWPLLPTTCGKLVPIVLAKKIFDLSLSSDWSPQQLNVVRVLCKLRCPEVDVDIVKDISVLKSYVALPHKPQDVIEVLDYHLNEHNVSALLTKKEMMTLLEFLQGDIDSFNSQQKATIKRLPFFTSIDGDLVGIENVQAVYVVPPGIPLEESNVWMSANDSLFLAPNPTLERLYNKLGVKVQTQVSCYLNFIFPHFSTLKPATRLAHLQYIRDVILYRADDEDEMLMVTTMAKLTFLPDASGKLHRASNFYDPENSVYKIMLHDNEFPQTPFRESDWLKFLRKIGLQSQVNQDQFLAFAKEIAHDSALEITNKLEKKSKTLVRYLISNRFLQEGVYLKIISKINFVTLHKASDALLLLHPQYRSTGNTKAEFGKFEGAVLFEHERLVWTSAMLLPSWIVAEAPPDVLKNLGVLSDPLIEHVVDQTEALSRTFSQSKDKEIHSSRRKELGKVMEAIYLFFKNKSECSNLPTIGDDCNANCCAIGDKLCSVPCVLVDDGRVFVRGDQLALEVKEEFPPHLYKIPIIYGPYLHLFIRLGAMANPSPLQYTKILLRLKDSCKDEKMHPDEERQAKQAVRGLFTTLQLHDEKRTKGKQDDEHEIHDGRIDDLKVLFLPSKDSKLMRSCDLVSNDAIRFKYRVSELQCHFLIDLSKCDLGTMVQENKLLPKQLRTKSLRSMVREELVPDCQTKLCSAFMEGKCEELNRLCRILKSPELVQGILRILKHQRQSTQLDIQVKEKVEELQTKVDLRCMELVQTHLILKETNKPVPKSEDSVACFVTAVDGRRNIHIKHGEKPTKLCNRLCDEINFATGNHIDYTNLRNLHTCLTCDSPEDISAALDGEDVTPDSEEHIKQTSDVELGTEIPFELHQLLVQFEDFIFYPGEIVGYEKDDAEDYSSDPTYIFARIIRRVETHPKTEKEKKKERKKGKSKVKAKQESILLSRYLIDIGTEQIEVDVLDLYKFERQETEEEDEKEKRSEATGGSVSSLALVPYKGTGRGRSKPSKKSPKADPKPRTLEEALKEVRKAFAEIRKLPKDKQKKAIRRLYLRWHPDKNPPDMQEIANEVAKFIQKEAEKLESGTMSDPGSDGGFYRDAGFDYESFFRNWGYRASRQRSSYDNFRRNNPNYGARFRSRFGGGASNFRGGASSFSGSSSYRSRSTGCARQWITQAQEDLRAVKHLLSARDPFYNLVCFHCHEVAEKALISALFAVTGVADSQLNSHDILSLADSVSRIPGSPPNLTNLASKLWGYKDATRFPYKHFPSKVPADVYTYQQAQEAFGIAKEILEEMQQFTGIRR